ncbi:MAG: SDR family NAD(P)-dependent oxidoreductase, partial [Spirochaetaceae bacterium]|nr:SDR family NAD(P)-dependent oxidoreductase [Spirochaetaceae bacterium]
MTTNLFDLSDRRALVTGSSRGLGLVLATALAERGCTVVLNGRDQRRLDAAGERLLSRGLKIDTSPFDITDEQAVSHAISDIENTGPVDILVNNAGTQFRKNLEEFPEDEWRSILDVNLTGAFIVSKYVAQHMIPRRCGKIINICSLQSELGRATIAAYSASKGGL